MGVGFASSEGDELLAAVKTVGPAEVVDDERLGRFPDQVCARFSRAGEESSSCDPGGVGQSNRRPLLDLLPEPLATGEMVAPFDDLALSPLLTRDTLAALLLLRAGAALACDEDDDIGETLDAPGVLCSDAAFLAEVTAGGGGAPRFGCGRPLGGGGRLGPDGGGGRIGAFSSFSSSSSSGGVGGLGGTTGGLSSSGVGK